MESSQIKIEENLIKNDIGSMFCFDSTHYHLKRFDGISPKLRRRDIFFLFNHTEHYEHWSADKRHFRTNMLRNTLGSSLPPLS